MAVDLAQEMSHEMSRWSSGPGYLLDQIRRSMASVVLNCAEGNARKGEKERKRFFQIARASAAEVSSCIDLLSAFQLIATAKGNLWKTNLDIISKMLYALK